MFNVLAASTMRRDQQYVSMTPSAAFAVGHSVPIYGQTNTSDVIHEVRRPVTGDQLRLSSNPAAVPIHGRAKQRYHHGPIYLMVPDQIYGVGIASSTNMLNAISSVSVWPLCADSVLGRVAK